MNRLDGIRATGKQNLNATAENGEIINMTLYYLPAVQEWKIDISSNSFNLKSLRLFSSPNILGQYENLINYGLAVVTLEGGEPFLINDFSSKRVNIYVLSPSEILEIQEFYVSLKE